MKEPKAADRTTRLNRVSAIQVGKWHSIPLESAGELQYPCLVAAVSDHCETGLGRTLHLLIKFVCSETELREAVVEFCVDPAYFKFDVGVWQGIPEPWAGMVPSSVSSMLADPVAAPAVYFSAKLHYNFA